MHIDPKGFGPYGPQVTRSERAASQIQASSSDSRDGHSGPVRGSDRVEISEAGRARVAQGLDVSASGDLDEVRAAAIRARVLSGAYDSLEVADSIARTLLRTGDV